MEIKEINILDEEFDYEKYYGKEPDYEILRRDKTVEVIFIDEKKEEKKEYYGFADKKQLYEDIKEGKEININRCYIENFSLVEYRKLNNIPEVTLIEIKIFSAIDSFIKNASFYSAQFSGDASFYSAQFSGDASFINAQFSGDASFDSAQFSGDASFYSAQFSGEASFYSAQFSGDTYFSTAQFSENAFFYSAQFSGEAHFNFAQFSENASFYSAQFSENAFFYSAQFSGHANFHFAHFFEKVNYEKAKFFEIASFKNVYFQHPAFFSRCEFKITNFYGAVFKEYGLFKECKIEEANRETFRIIKHELVKTNNKLDASEYHVKEMEAYRKELKEFKFPKKFQDKFILFLNRISNYYGSSWLRGVAFTLFVAIFFFTLYLLTLKEPFFICESHGLPGFCELFILTIKYYSQFLYAGHPFDFMKEFNPNGCGYAVDLISRIFIGYGYYQIIQPMRKYKMW